MQRPRLINMAAAQEGHEMFLHRTVRQQSVWTVWGGTGPLIVASNYPPDDEADGNHVDRDVYLFFSDEAYARRALNESWPDLPSGSTRSIPLFDFLYRWLPGLHRDRHLAGTNWTGDLIGLEVEPSALQAQLHDCLPENLRVQFGEMLAADSAQAAG
jgi:hypothetical protein